jgi:hypothetical protein
LATVLVRFLDRTALLFAKPVTMTEARVINFVAKVRSSFFVCALSAPLFALKLTEMDTGLAVETLAAKMMVVAGDETAGLVPLEALVATTTHVLALITVSEPPEITQPVAKSLPCHFGRIRSVSSLPRRRTQRGGARVVADERLVNPSSMGYGNQ